jgi:predicted aspartyl protease
MGSFFVRCKVENIVARDKSAVIPKIVVDTGSEYTWIARETLEKIGIQ